MILNGRVGSKVINLGFDSRDGITLEKFMLDSNSIPISLFNGANAHSGITDAIAYLTDKKDGVVFIPAEGSTPAVKLIASMNNIGEVRINFLTSSHKHPTTEARPYTDEPWQVGDIIISNATDTTLCLGWICTEAGIPGKWEQFGHIKRWYSQLEKVDYLPDPSELQAERQLVYANPDSNQVDIYFCTQVPPSTDWSWVKETIYDSDIRRVVEEHYDSLMRDQLDQILLEVIAEYFMQNPIKNDVEEYFNEHPIKDTVSEYIDENPITNEVHTSLLASAWVGTSSPYTQTITNDLFAKAVSGIMNLAPEITDEEVDQATQADMIITNQTSTSITISAYGIKPTSDIPLLIVLINTNYSK